MNEKLIPVKFDAVIRAEEWPPVSLQPGGPSRNYYYSILLRTEYIAKWLDDYCVTWRRKTGIVESEEKSIDRRRFRKRVPTATNTIAIIEELLRYKKRKRCFLCGSCRNVISRVSWVPKENSRQAVLNESQWRIEVSAGSWRISTVSSCCQGTAGVDREGWEKFRKCCDDLWIVKIGDGAVITCSSEWFV
jgi:hypothetical protein